MIEIKFSTSHLGHQVACYEKEKGKFDVYISGKCIKTGVSLDWVSLFKSLLIERHPFSMNSCYNID